MDKAAETESLQEVEEVPEPRPRYRAIVEYGMCGLSAYKELLPVPMTKVLQVIPFKTEESSLE